MTTPNTTNDQKDDISSPERRKIIKKAAYTAPALVVLGVIAPIDKAYAYSLPPTDPSAPYTPY